MKLYRQGQRFAVALAMLDWFVPLSIRADKAQRTRAYVVIGIILINLVVCALSGMALYATSLSPEAKLAGTVVTVFSGCLYVVALAIFRWQHSYLLAGNFAVAAVYTAVLSSVVMTGGYSISPVMPLWIVVPVFVFPLAGPRSGMVWAIIIFLTMIALLTAHLFGFSAWQLADIETLRAIERVVPIVLCFMVVTALIIYEQVNEKLHKWLEEERRRFAFKASHDSLTDLPNREEFYSRLDTALRESTQKRLQLALVYIDLDGFKPVNDTYGHYAGDKVLKVTAQRLREVLRHTDVAARIGGDEFALILHGIQRRSDIDLALNKLLHTLSIPIDIEGREVRVCASAGVAVFPQDGRDMFALCRLADGAMYEAKVEKNTFRYHSPFRPAEII
ncbi:MAG TPA: GGDEF domain-containing protein [Pseudomonadales bacterium]|nr:GGDEF domain-containing protein [Pseudomonadales bacterium]